MSGNTEQTISQIWLALYSIYLNQLFWYVYRIKRVYALFTYTILINEFRYSTFVRMRFQIDYDVLHLSRFEVRDVFRSNTGVNFFDIDLEGAAKSSRELN